MAGRNNCRAGAEPGWPRDRRRRHVTRPVRLPRWRVCVAVVMKGAAYAGCKARSSVTLFLRLPSFPCLRDSEVGSETLPSLGGRAGPEGRPPRRPTPAAAGASQTGSTLFPSPVPAPLAIVGRLCSFPAPESDRPLLSIVLRAPSPPAGPSLTLHLQTTDSLFSARQP